MRIRKVIVAMLATGLLMALAPAAIAAPKGKNCWGVVTSQRAQVEGADFGAHSSSFDTPRMGLGNTADAFGLSVPELGSFLASVDDFEETTCP